MLPGWVEPQPLRGHALLHSATRAGQLPLWTAIILLLLITDWPVNNMQMSPASENVYPKTEMLPNNDV